MESKRKYGFASASKEQCREWARLGGKIVSQDKEHMSRIGRIGGTKTSQNKKHMSDLGKIGGAKTAATHDMSALAKKGAASRWKKT